MSTARMVVALTVIAAVPGSAAWRVQPAASPGPLQTREAHERFLAQATIVGEPPGDGRVSWRVTLDDGTSTHAAFVEASDGSEPTTRDHRFNVAAFELDKMLGLNLVPVTVERTVSGRSASVMWAVDDIAMDELERRRKKIAPPDAARWRAQMQAVRVFDELISNTYRDIAPPLYLNTVWDNLLITRDWTVWLVDHTGAFRTRQRLEYPESLTACDRTLLTRLRGLNQAALTRALGKYLSPAQIDALERRRQLLVTHFAGQIAARGETAVLYDLPRRP